MNAFGIGLLALIVVWLGFGLYCVGKVSEAPRSGALDERHWIAPLLAFATLAFVVLSAPTPHTFGERAVVIGTMLAFFGLLGVIIWVGPATDRDDADL